MCITQHVALTKHSFLLSAMCGHWPVCAAARCRPVQLPCLPCLSPTLCLSPRPPPGHQPQSLSITAKSQGSCAVSEVCMHSAVSVLLLNSFVLSLSYPDLAAAIQIYTFRIKYKPLKIQNRSCIKIVLSMSAGSESRKCHNPS